MFIDNVIHIHTEDDQALRRALFNRHLELVKYLVKSGSDIHAENDFEKGENVSRRREPRISECIKITQELKDENYNLARYLVGRDFGLYVVECILHRAFDSNGLNLVKHLLDNAVKDKSKDKWRLELCTGNGSPVICQCFIQDSGIDICLENEIALISASKAGNDAAEFFLGQGVKLKIDKESLLVNTSNNDHSGSVGVLIKLGANIHCEGDPALRKAIDHRNLELVKYLIRKWGRLSCKQ
ncbi:hypothetical protein BB560_005298 [Smittium megazygosporum]|uniref:Uncharacterized protein n=1 Tax=Smittium megazygosporum TaxID=133381 RepID=A0A2T9Z703_9FUNG|nr:hypothetical protein BB560_005298 [Smittium megazygosporum]